DQTFPIALSRIHQRPHLIGREGAFPLASVVFHWLNCEARVHGYVTLLPRGVERARQNGDVDIQRRWSEAARLAPVTEVGDVLTVDCSNVETRLRPEKLGKLTHRVLVARSGLGCT